MTLPASVATGSLARAKLASCSEFSAKEDVLDPGALERLRKHLTIELPVEAAIWVRSHVGYHIDTVLGEKRGKLRYLVVGVPDREEGRLLSCTLNHGSSKTVATTFQWYP